MLFKPGNGKSGVTFPQTHHPVMSNWHHFSPNTSE